MLYQSEVGRASACEAITTYWPAHDADGELTATLRDFANTLVRGTLDRIKEIDAILASLSDDERAAIRVSVALPPGVDEKTRARTEEANLRRVIRERFELPRLTLFR